MNGLAGESSVAVPVAGRVVAGVALFLGRAEGLVSLRDKAVAE